MSRPEMGVHRHVLPSLSELVESMHSLLRGDLSAEELGHRLGVPAERIEIYQRFVFSHVAEMLQLNFEVVHATLPSAVWDQLTRAYFHEHPCWEYELNANGAAFPGFLGEWTAGGELGIREVHAEIAQLEWEELVAYFAEVDAPASGAPELNPTLSVCQFSYPVLAFVERVREALRLDDPLPELPAHRLPERVLVFRDAQSHVVVSESATDDLLFSIKMVHEGVSCADAARQGGLSEVAVRAMHQRAVEIGLAVVPTLVPRHRGDDRLRARHWRQGQGATTKG